MEPISILFKEYDALRTEVLGRTSHGHKIGAIGAVVLTWLLARPIDAKFWMILVAVSIVFLTAAWMTFRDINKASAKLKELEQEINSLAGARLLQWESYWGSATMGYFSWGPPQRSNDLN
jgi:sulfite exporter TauE/SafE